MPSDLEYIVTGALLKCSEFKGSPIKEYIYKDGSRFYKDKDGNIIEDN